MLLLESICVGFLALLAKCGEIPGLPRGYNRHLRPSHKGPADKVEVGLKIYSIGPVSESDMTMTMDLFLRYKWTDKRLLKTAEKLLRDNSSDHYLNTLNQSDPSFESMAKKFSENRPSRITLGEDYSEAVWKPDIFFADAVQIQRPGKGLLSNSMVFVLLKEGEVQKSMRLLMKTRCKMDLTFFPMDIQHCSVCFESYQYAVSDLNILWWEGKVEMDYSKISQYGTASFNIDKKLRNYTVESTPMEGYTYRSLCVKAKLSRKLSIFVITMYLPSISLVALSWVGFWIDKRAVPARASLTITTILAQITLITGAANQFPGIADLKVADLYLIINFFYVFASLIEFALVSYEPPVQKSSKSKLESATRKLKAFGKPKYPLPIKTQINESNISHGTDSNINNCIRRLSPSDEQSNNSSNQPFLNNDEEAEIVKPEQKNSKKSGRGNTLGERILYFCSTKYFCKENADEISKWMFPFSFLVWNLMYFGISMTKAGRLEDGNSILS